MVQKPIDKEYLLRQLRNFDSEVIENKLVDIRENVTVLQQDVQDITTTSDNSMPNSYEGKLKINKIGGVCEQFTTTGGIPSPNPEYPQEIKKSIISEIKTHGKNFFDITTLKPRSTNQGGTVSLNGDIANISSANQTWASCLGKKSNVEIGKNYVMSFKVSNYSANTRTHVSFNNGEKEFYNFVFSNNGKYEIPITATTSTLIIGFCSNGSSSTVNNTFTISEVQLEEGTIATEYEPYTESVVTLSEPIELYGNNNVQDAIEDSKIKRRFATIVFDGSDDEVWFSRTEPVRMCNDSLASTIKIPASNNEKVALLCSCLENKTAMETYKKTVGISIQESNGRIYIYLGDDATIDDWKAYLQANPMTVIYELAEEIAEELPTDDQYLLNNLSTFDPITHLVFESEIQPTFEVEYGSSKVGGYTLESLIGNEDIMETTRSSFNSVTGGLIIDEITAGQCEQFTTTGAQLFDIDSLSVQSVGNDNPTVTVEGKKVTVSGKGSYAQAFYTVENLTNLIDKDVILSYEKLSSSNSSAAAILQLAVTYSDGTKKYHTTDDSKSVTLSVTNTVTELQVRIICNNSSSALETENVMTVEGVMLNVGTIALPWEKYTGGQPSPSPSYPQEIKKSVVSGIKSYGGENFYDGTLYGGYYSNANFDLSLANVAVYKSIKVYLTKGTHTILFSKKVNVVRLVADGVITETTAINVMSYTFTANSNGYVGISFRDATSSTTVWDETTAIGIYNTSAITFSQPIELYGIGDVQDILTPQKINRKYEYTRVTGSDVKSVISYADAGNAIITNKATKIDGKCLSNGFIGVSFNDRVKDVNSFRCYADTTGYIVFRVPKSENENFASKDDAINFFDNNEIFMAYELANETTEALPIVDQVALNSLETFDGINYIELDSEIEPTCKVRYGISEFGGLVTKAYCNSISSNISNEDHFDDTSNPHAVTKAQVGLGNVPNVTTNNQTPTYTEASSLTKLSSGETLSVAMGKTSKAVTDLISHVGNKSNPHAVTKAQVGLGNVDNTADASKPVSTAQQTAINTAYNNAKSYTDQKIADLINGAPTTLDTLGEIADAMAENEDVVDALEAAVGKKANQTDLTSHTGNTTVHITAAERTDWNTAKNTVNQSLSGTSNYRPLILGANNSSDPSELNENVTHAVNTATNMYAQPSTGMLATTSYKLAEKVKLEYNSTTESLDFTFL